MRDSLVAVELVSQTHITSEKNQDFYINSHGLKFTAPRVRVFRYHFDSIGPALLSSMIVTTLDGWVEIYHEATNAYMVDHQPSENCNVSHWDRPTGRQPTRFVATIVA